MKSIFVDTSALIAIGNKRDAFHLQALKVKNELRKSQKNIVITNAIILEFGNAFSILKLKSTAIKMIEAIRSSKKWKCVNIDDALIEQAFQKFKQMDDKEWGLVDCMSIVVAKDLEITDIFTTDHHFEQAGFSILLK
ncbi:Type II toxin-antitoxin system VapC family toxin [Candidatus Magnetomoraceae bacterium gMMP-15]